MGATVSVEDDPTTVLIAWHQALEEERPRDAWALLAPSAREGLSEDAFVALYGRERAALTERARQLVQWALRHPASEQATVVVGGRQVWLVRTRDGWRVDGAASEPDGQGALPTQ